MAPSFSLEQNHLCNFGREHQEEHFCEITFNLDEQFRRRCLLKEFLPAILFSRAELFVLFLEGIIRNIPVKLFIIWVSGSGGDVGFSSEPS